LLFQEFLVCTESSSSTFHL